VAGDGLPAADAAAAAAAGRRASLVQRVRRTFRLPEDEELVSGPCGRPRDLKS
jgi:hypothetical protein